MKAKLEKLFKERGAIMFLDHVMTELVNQNEFSQRDETRRYAWEIIEDYLLFKKGIKGKVKEKKPEDFIDRVIKVFADVYFEVFKLQYEILYVGIERKSAGKIMAEYRKKYPTHNEMQALESLRAYFNACCNVTDGWFRKNMSLRIIASKFNEINKIIKNGTSNKSNLSTSDKELAKTIGMYFSQDR